MLVHAVLSHVMPLPADSSTLFFRLHRVVALIFPAHLRAAPESPICGFLHDYAAFVPLLC
jgi:hypothetical protein